MSNRAVAAVWRESKAKHDARLVLLTLADYAHDDGRNAFPTIKTLASKTLITERNVRNCLATLVALGEIEKDGITRSGVDIWRIVLPSLDSSLDLEKFSTGRKNFPKSSDDTSIRELSNLDAHARESAKERLSSLPTTIGAELKHPYWHENDYRLQVFNTLWAIWAKKPNQSKIKALQAFRLHVGSEVDIPGDEASEAFKRGLNVALAHWQKASTEEQFIPHLATWLNQERWRQ